MKRKSIFAIAVVALYSAVIGLAPLPDRLMLFPTTRPIDPGAAERKILPFAGGELEIWTARSQLARKSGRPEIYVLRFYGNADRAERWVADEAEMWKPPRSGSMGNELPRLRREHRARATRTHRAGGDDRF